MPVQLCSDLSKQYQYDICNGGYDNAVLTHCIVVPPIYTWFAILFNFFVSFHRRDVYIKLDKEMGNPRTTAIYIYIYINKNINIYNNHTPWDIDWKWVFLFAEGKTK